MPEFMPMPEFMFMLTEGAVTGRATGMEGAGRFSAIGAMDIRAEAGRAATPGAGAPSRSAPVVSCSKGMARDCRIMLSRLTTLRRARNELRSATPDILREGSEDEDVAAGASTPPTAPAAPWNSPRARRSAYESGALPALRLGRSVPASPCCCEDPASAVTRCIELAVPFIHDGASPGALALTGR